MLKVRIDGDSQGASILSSEGSHQADSINRQCSLDFGSGWLDLNPQGIEGNIGLTLIDKRGYNFGLHLNTSPLRLNSLLFADVLQGLSFLLDRLQLTSDRR